MTSAAARINMDRSKKPKSSNLASRRRFELLDLNKSTSSLNMSTSSLRSVGEETRKGGGAVAVQARRRAAAVRFAPPPLSSATNASSGPAGSNSDQSRQAMAMARPATASGARPGSASGTRCRTPAGRLPEPGPKAMRRSWGWTAAELDAKEPAASGNAVVAKVVAKTHSRSSSVPRRLPAEEKEKPLLKRGSKIMTTSTSRTKTNLGTRPKAETHGSRSPPGVAAATTNMKAPDSVSPKNMDTVSVSPPTKTSVETIGAGWESLPSDLQNLGLEVMRYRDDAEAAAVEALRESSAAETLLRCLSAFADLTSAVAELSPQQTVDEFLALHGALAAAVPHDDNREGHTAGAGAWLRAAVASDLAHFSLLYPAASPCKSNGAASPTVSPASPTPRPVPSGEAGAEEPWLEAARRALGEEMRAWFLGHVERLLDGDVAGTLGQLKRVNDWLDLDAVGLGLESDAVERVKKKIYSYLLDHVESAVVALNGGVAAPRRK